METTITPKNPSAVLMTGSIFDVLYSEHQEIARLMEAVMQAPDEPTRSRRFRELDDVLVPHAKAEEEVVYPRLVAHPRSRQLALEAQQEHQILLTELTRLRAQGVRGESWMARFIVLKDDIYQHLAEEEADLLDVARRVLGPVQLGLAADFAASKQRHAARRQPW